MDIIKVVDLLFVQRKLKKSVYTIISQIIVKIFIGKSTLSMHYLSEKKMTATTLNLMATIGVRKIELLSTL